MGLEARLGGLCVIEIGIRREATGNSKATEPLWFSMGIHPSCWEGSKKFSRNRERDRVRERRNHIAQKGTEGGLVFMGLAAGIED